MPTKKQATKREKAADTSILGSIVLTHNQLLDFAQSGRLPSWNLSEPSKSEFTAAKEFKLFQTKIDFKDLKYLYQREGLATNAVDVPANDAFSKWFEVRSYSDSAKQIENKTLEDAIWKLNRDLNVRSRFLEAYVYCRLYGLGLVVIGLKDSTGDMSKKPQNVTGVDYLVALSAAEVKEIHFDENPKSPTYGEIDHYTLRIKSKSGEQNKDIHASRVIHVMQKTLEKSPWGLSILEPAFDLFEVLKNIDWSSGEAYYQNASPLYVLTYKGHPSAEDLGQAEEDMKEIRVTSRYIKPESWELSTVPGSGVALDPTKYFDPIVERIAGAVKVPKQILLGTAAGALASGQVNLAQYYKDIAAIQTNFIEPLLLDFYTRLQKWKILPKGDFDLEWATLWEMDEKEKALLTMQKAVTARNLVGNPGQGIPEIATVPEVRKNILGLEPELGAGLDSAKPSKEKKKHALPK
jgi:phage-related protein (TIGR01555 family)